MRTPDRRSVWLACAVLIAVAATASANSQPEVTDVTAQQRPNSTLVDIYYDVYDADGDQLVVSAKCSDGAGGWETVSSTQYGSDIGPGVSSGQNKHIVWDAGIDMPGHAGDDYVVRVTACDTGDIPGMVLVQAGIFKMGDGTAYCGVDERWVTLTNDFYLGQHEVTNAEYAEALQWAYDQNPRLVTATSSSVRDAMDESTQELLDLDDSDCEISFSGVVFTVDAGKEQHPVIEVTWFGAARYCDWLSLASEPQLDRAYDHSGDWLCNGHDPYGAEGYRLPTDAEWEYAAQYNDERIYPWGSESPSCARANYYGCEGWTLPVGSCSPDGDSQLGFWDLAGNVWEWCNDWHECDLGDGAEQNPVGYQGGLNDLRVLRGGSWYSYVSYLRCAPRDYGSPVSRDNYGFRVARTVNP